MESFRSGLCFYAQFFQTLLDTFLERPRHAFQECTGDVLVLDYLAPRFLAFFSASEAMSIRAMDRVALGDRSMIVSKFFSAEGSHVMPFFLVGDFFLSRLRPNSRLVIKSW